MANYYVSSVRWTAIPAWSNHVAVLGEYVRQLAAPTMGNQRVWRCTVAGATGAVEPAWTLTQNSVTVDNIARWTQVHGVEAEQLAGNWRAAAANILALKNSITTNGEDHIFVSDDHAEVHTANPSLNILGSFYSVDRTGATLPPTSADLGAGAIMEVTGVNWTLDFNTSRFWGFTFKGGSGQAGSTNMSFRIRGAQAIYDDCTFQLLSLGGSGRFNLGSSDTFSGRLILRNPQFRFSHLTQGISGGGDHVEIYQEGASPPAFVDAGGTLPTNLFMSDSVVRSYYSIHDVDFSAINADLFNSNDGGPNFGFDFVRCKFPSTTLQTFVDQAGNQSVYRQVRRFWDCSDGGPLANRFAFDTLWLTGITHDLVYRAGGASDGADSYSWRVQNTSGIRPDPANVGELPADFSVYIGASQLGNPVTVTMHFLSGWAMNDALYWMELETLQDAASNLGKLESSRAADWLNAGTALDTTTEDWTGAVALRQNSTSYNQYDVIQVASNPGRVFLKTNAAGGTSAAAEPAGMATAIDGGTVTDNGVTWTAMRRLKIEITFTPEQVGWIRARLKHRYDLTVPWFIDPKLVVS
jgi:hypothetical protein